MRETAFVFSDVEKRIQNMNRNTSIWIGNDNADLDGECP
jgi:hypothetical protein|tara:strand:- start:105 stop:221 length:117 start_codon:yes stop_codon:yes gene_type:complete